MRSKIISFIIGGVIGFCLWSIQVKAWASPIGLETMQKQEIADPEEYMEINYVDIPQEISEVCEKYGEEYGICPEIGEALVWRETRCKNIDNGSCKGYAQINTNVHKSRMKRLGVNDIHNMDGNIHIAFDYLSELYQKNGDIAKALDEYNGNGRGGKSKYAKQILVVARCLDLTGGD